MIVLTSMGCEISFDAFVTFDFRSDDGCRAGFLFPLCVKFLDWFLTIGEIESKLLDYLEGGYGLRWRPVMFLLWLTWLGKTYFCFF